MILYSPVHEIFSIGSFHVYSWGLMFVLGFIVASFFVLRESEKRKIDQNFILNVLLMILLGAVLGGRLFFVFEHLGYFLNHLGEIFAFGQGGETSYGGILLSLFFVWIYTKFSKNPSKIKFSQVLDLIAPYAVLAAAIARIGCFLNWCCYGIQSNLLWAIQVSGDIARHPTQLYELVYCLIIFGLLVWFKKIKEKGKQVVSVKNANTTEHTSLDSANTASKVVLKHTENKISGFRKLLNKNGALFLFFLIFYSVFRFFNDFLRVYDNYFLGLAESQWILMIVFVISILVLWKKN